MWTVKQQTSGDPAEWLGDWHPLAEQLGSTNGLAALSDMWVSLQAQPVRDLPSLRNFLRQYQTHVLLPLELPAIQKAFHHASHNEVRELIAFDQELGGEKAMNCFAEASQRVGQHQLQKLKPLRDDRFVQRYLAAVERNDAVAWHTLVYGITLALYSMPLRQGLLGYGWQTTRGFIHAAAHSLQLSEKECRDLVEEICSGLPAAVELLISRRVAA